LLGKSEAYGPPTEATQAAAADEQSVYAIFSTCMAKSYRLQVPAKGNQSVLARKQSALFDGIATDSKTGGLLGTLRANRQVVFAVPNRP